MKNDRSRGRRYAGIAAGTLSIVGVLAAVAVVQFTLTQDQPSEPVRSLETVTSDESPPAMSADVSFPAFGVYLNRVAERQVGVATTPEQALAAASRIGAIAEQVMGIEASVTLNDYTQTFDGNPMASAQDSKAVTRLAWDVEFVGSAPDLHLPGSLSDEAGQAAAAKYGDCQTHVLVAADTAEVLQIFQACGLR